MAAVPASPTRPNMPSGYGINTEAGGMLTWEWVDSQLTKSRNYWIGSTRPDGRPHVTPVWGVWMDGAVYFSSDPNSRRARNIAANPEVVVHLESGDDVVILEGRVELVTDTDLYKRVGKVYNKKYKMPVFSDSEPGSPLYEVKPRLVMAWQESDFPNTATRWIFDEQK